MADKSIIRQISEFNEYLSPIQYNILKLLTKTGPKTRRELVYQLSKPRSTIYDNLLKLSKRKLVEKYTRNEGHRGRPLVFWKIREE